MRTRRLFKLVLATLPFFLGMNLAAQEFPNKIINLIVPYQAGGGSDFSARLIQPEYQKRMGQTVVVENLAGASGAIGAQKVLGAQADGHTQLLGSPFETVLVPLAVKAITYKPEDFRLAHLVSMLDIGLVVRNDIPARNVDEFIAWAKKQKHVTYGSVGQGSLYHLMGLRFAELTGLPMTHVPYKGVANVSSDLAASQIDMAFMPFLGPTVSMVKDGKYKALGVASSRKIEVLPNLPSMAKTPGLQDFHFETWVGVMVPKSTPDRAVQKVHDAVSAVLKLPDIQKRTIESGAIIPAVMSFEETDKYYKQQIERYREISRAAGIDPQ